MKVSEKGACSRSLELGGSGYRSGHPGLCRVNGLHVPKVQADQEADSSGLIENWPGHNCPKNGRCIKKKSLPSGKRKKMGSFSAPSPLDKNLSLLAVFYVFAPTETSSSQACQYYRINIKIPVVLLT